MKACTHTHMHDKIITSVYVYTHYFQVMSGSRMAGLHASATVRWPFRAAICIGVSLHCGHVS